MTPPDQQTHLQLQSKSKSSRGGANQQTVQEGLETLQTLIPGFAPNLDAMKASCWVSHAVQHWETAVTF